VRHARFAADFFDVVYAVFSIEHIGVTARYGLTKQDLERDAKAIKEIGRILGGAGRLLVTVPYRKRYKPRRLDERVYDEQSSLKLFNVGIQSKTIYQSSEAFWMPVSERESLKEGEEAVALVELGLDK